MSFFNQDFSGVNQEQTEVILPPTIQWWRGLRGQSDGVLDTGGFELSVEWYSIEGQETIHFKNNDSDHGMGYGFRGLNLQVLAVSKVWNDKKTKQRVFGYKEGQRAYSTLRLWCFVKEIDNEFLLSFSGMNSKAMEDTLELFKKSMIKVASDRADIMFPTYSFWLPVTFSPAKQWEKGGYSTLPRMALNPPFKEETFEKYYVGDEMMAKAEARYKVAQSWAEQMKGQDIGSGDEPQQNGNGQTEQPPVFIDDDGVVTDEPQVPDFSKINEIEF